MTTRDHMRILSDALNAAYTAGYHDDPQEGPDVAELWAELSEELEELESIGTLVLLDLCDEDTGWYYQFVSALQRARLVLRKGG